jgi:hypothetical protein
MTVSRPCYCTREMVMMALDIKLTARSANAVDRAIETAADNIDGQMGRVFFPEDKTCKFDWPDPSGAPAWRLWLERNEIADIVTKVPVVTSGGNVIPASSLLWYPPNQGPPFTRVEIDQSQTASFGQGPTSQLDIAINGTFGFWTLTNPAGALAAAMIDTTTGLATVTNSTAVGVGDILIVGTERMLVTDKAMVSTGQTQLSGVATADASVVALGVTDGTKFFPGEVILLDSERMLIVDVAGNTLTVKRGWDGTVLATHSGATIFAPRNLTVTRGALGTTAATHLNGSAAAVSRVPTIIRDLSIGEASVQGEMEIGGYAGSQGQGSATVADIGDGLADKWEEAKTRYGRQIRLSAI